MSTVEIELDSYVDIATSMVMQDTDLERLKRIVLESCETRAVQTSRLGGTGIAFNTSSLNLLKFEWNKQIKEWQKFFPDRGPSIKDLTSLKDFQFGAFFLQKPLSAMSLWNVMQIFYTLDRLVCCNSETDSGRVIEWELMPIFAYLEAKNVKRWWNTSLQNLGKVIQDNNSPKRPTGNVLFGGSKPSSKQTLNGKSKEQALRRMDGISFGITKLEDAQRELRRSWKMNLEGVDIVDLMLAKISKAAETRFSMIDDVLKMDKIQEGGRNVGNGIPNRGLAEPEFYRPPKRSNSLDLVKRECMYSFHKHLSFRINFLTVTSAWVSTERGDASLTAIAILFILLGCLHHLRKYLIAGSDSLYHA